jgi:hypothetical protein
MLVILYPNNLAYKDYENKLSIGTNETFGIPAVRMARSKKNIEDTETYYVDGHTIKAFYTTLDYEAIKENVKEYQREYQKQMRDAGIVRPRKRKRYSDIKKEKMLKGIARSYNRKRDAFPLCLEVT